MTISPALSPEVAALAADLRARREQNQAAVRAQLLAAGYPPAQVELGLSQIYGYQESGRVIPTAPFINGTAVMVTISVNVVLNVAGVALLNITLLGLAVIVAVPLMEFLAGAIIINHGNSAVGKGILFGIWRALPLAQC